MRRSSRSISALLLGRNGASAVEFALIVPLLMAALFGTFQYGVLMFTYNAMLDTARDASRKLATGSVNAAVARQEAIDSLPSWIAAGKWTVAATDAVAPATQVSTTISIDADDATIISIVPMPATIDVNVVMRKEA